jgi:predicted ATPase/DNA-binding SARP family transcriptional activator
VTGDGSLDLRVLGPVEVRVADRPVVIGSPMQRRLLAALIVRVGEVVSADRLIDILWGGAPPRSALTGLRTYVARLRETLRSVSVAPPIRPSAPGYLLDVPLDAIDAHRFERAVGVARDRLDHDPDTVARDLRCALDMWRGPAFAEFADEAFVLAEAARLDELRLVAAEVRGSALIAGGRPGEAASELEVVLAERPMREDGQALLITALARAGRVPRALEVYREYTALLRDELGIDPSRRLQVLHTEILAGRHDSPGHVPARRRGGNLPLRMSSLVGREQERAELVRSIGRHRVVTVTGMGGVGKTAFALDAAQDLGGQFPDGTWLCELAPVRVPDAVPHAVAASMGVVLAADQSPEQGLTAALGTRRSLIVLDNCEHLLDAAARLVATICQSCPHVRVLATSRERLGVDGECLVPLRPLAVPADGVSTTDGMSAAPAAVLFAERARAANPEFEITPTNAGLVGEVCRSLDGLPLALELTAARLAAFTLDDVVARLGDQLDLASSLRTVESRHRTLRHVLDWSYDLLGEPERRVLERLSVFGGGFTLAHAERVCADRDVPAGRVVDLLAGLIGKSLVVRPADDRPGRYRMLETLRRYAHERLVDRDESDTFRRAHARCMVAFAEQAAAGLAGADEESWAHRVEAEVDNLRIAHRWALDHGDLDVALRMSAALHRFAFWRLRYEILGWAVAAADRFAGRRHPLAGVVLASAGIAGWTRGDLSNAADRSRSSLTTLGATDATELEDDGSGLPSELLGDVALFGGRPRAAADAYASAARAFAASGDAQSAVFNFGSQALGLAYADDLPTARTVLAETRHRAAESDNPTARAYALYAEGECLLDHDPDRALVLLDQARGLADSVGNEFVSGVAAVSAASLQARHGDPTRALRWFGEVIDRWRRTGNWMQQWTTLRNLAELLVRLGEDRPAAILYGAATGGDRAERVYGAEAHRLDEARSLLATRLGAQSLAALTDQGGQLSGAESVTLASDEIARITGAGSAGGPAESAAGD